MPPGGATSGELDAVWIVFGDHLNIVGAAPAHPGVGHRNERNAVGRSFLDRRLRCVKERKHADIVAAAGSGMSTPMRRIRSRGCCARAASGHATAAPPSSVMNSRRLMSDMGDSPPLGQAPLIMTSAAHGRPVGLTFKPATRRQVRPWLRSESF